MMKITSKPVKDKGTQVSVSISGDGDEFENLAELTLIVMSVMNNITTDLEKRNAFLLALADALL